MANDKFIQLIEASHLKEEPIINLNDGDQNCINSYMNLHHIINDVLNHYPLIAKETDSFKDQIYKFLDTIFSYENNFYNGKNLEETRAMAILILSSNFILYNTKDQTIMLTGDHEDNKNRVNQYKMILNYIMNKHSDEITDKSNFRPDIIIKFIDINTNACKCINPATAEIWTISENDATEAMNIGGISELIKLIYKDKSYI